ncbi:MAG: hypothetical protein ACPKPY_05210, partial [Nitrososphaeraceae archaeon]
MKSTNSIHCYDRGTTINNSSDMGLKEISLKISKHLESQNIIRKFVFNSKNVILEFNDTYQNKLVILSTCYDDWNKFIDRSEKRLERKRIETNHINLIVDVLDNNYKIISCLEPTYNNTDKLPKDIEEYKLEKFTSFENWQIKLGERYQKLQNKVNELIPGLWEPLEFALSVKSILNIKDCTLPFIGIILGPPGAVKTLTIELFRSYYLVFYTDNFSAKSFVSHNTSVKREQLKEIDLLPKIKNKFFLTPELSPTFSKRDDELNEILGIITRIADGHGYESDSGAQGHRGYSGEYMFAWLGAGVDIPRKVHKLLGTLGPKLYFFRLPKKEHNMEDDDLERLRNSDKFKTIKNEIKKLLIEYMITFESCPISEKLDDENNSHKPIKIQWNDEKDNEQALRYIIRLAKLLAHLRGVVSTWETRDTQGSDYAYTFSTKEEPERASIQLRNIARGHALSQGRNYITIDDIPLVIQIVLSTASKERVIIFDCLLRHNGIVSTEEVSKHLNISKPTALRTMTEFTALELVHKITLGDEENAPIQIQLKGDFKWFLSEEFKNLRDNFGKEYLNEYLMKKNELQNTKKLEIIDSRCKEKITLTTTIINDNENS